MRGRFRATSFSGWPLIFSLLLINLGLRDAVAAGEAKSSDANDAALFGPTKVLSIHLEISAAEYEAMQPAPGGFGFGGPPPGEGAPTPPPKLPAGKPRDSEKNLFGTDFPWVEGKFVHDGKSFDKVGIRYAGDITYLVSGRGLKRPLKISFDKFGGERLHGMRAIQLHAMPLDPSKGREVLAHSVFQAAGVPTARTAFAEVTLTVPGKHDKAYLGLFTLLENVDDAFLADRFGSSDGLLMKPFRIRGIDFLGDDWSRYPELYRPEREAAPNEAKRMIEFAKLVNQASDDEFRQQIGEFIDVDAFLRFLAANALTSNLESFFSLGQNYALYLDPRSHKFHFLPGDLEFSLANFLLMGSPEQLMDLSVTKPYPGENKLPDRLLALKDVREKYLALLKELTAKSFTKDQLLKDAQAIDSATKVIREKEAAAVAARNEPPPGFGGPGAGPQPPDLKTFAEKRTASVASQLAAKTKGFVPQPFGFGPPPGGGGGPGRTGGNAQPIDERAFRESVQAPPEFVATLYAAAPKVNYPVAISAEPAGAIYVAVDEQGSLGRTPGGGKILRCVDEDGDGKVDDITVYAKVEHPRGVCYAAGSVWVMHPPTLSVFRDVDGDGVSDEQDVLVTGLTTNQINDRGGDHTTNCVRLGIDGWLYIGVGDYGIKEAQGKDGTKIVLRGGGIVRVRPDGTELEIFCSGLRNPFDIAIDPFLNLFTRDNTNDGGGWDTRVSHLRQTGLYGYTQLYANFTDEILPPLGTFGGGGGTGGLFIQEPRWPAPYSQMLLTGDWGRSEVYRHELKPNGTTFDLQQEVFLKVPRATGMDIDARGCLYVASWYGGEASVFVGPNVGFITRIAPKGFETGNVPDFKTISSEHLIRLLMSPQAVMRLHAQRELLKRGPDADVSRTLYALARSDEYSLEARVAAIFTLKQLDGRKVQTLLLSLTEFAPIREFALRAMTDRRTEFGELDLGEGDPTDVYLEPIFSALDDESPRVRAQALISLSRLNHPGAAKRILPLTSRTTGSSMPTQRPLQNQPDPDRIIPHLAVRALVSLEAVDACLEGLDGPHWTGALWALRSMHSPRVVDGLIRKLATARSADLRRGILVALIRLYHREADYKGSWWGIRPDNTGPYYDRVEWEQSPRIAAVITTAALDGDSETVTVLKRELQRHRVSLAGLSASTELVQAEKEQPLVLPKADPKNPNQLGNLPFETAAQRALAAEGNSKRGEALFKSQSCASCHTTADGQTPKGPHLVDIGKRYKADELIESILKPSAKLAQGYETQVLVTHQGQTVSGFVVSEGAEAIQLREGTGLPREVKREDIEERTLQKISAMPEGLLANLTAEDLADLLAYLQSLK